MHDRSSFLKSFGSERVNKSQKQLKFQKSTFMLLFIILSQIVLENVIFNKIWDFRTAC